MGVYDRLRATAKRLVDKYGREITLVQSSTTPEDADKPWRGSEEPASGPSTYGTRIAVTGAFVRVTEKDEPFLLVKRGAMAVIVASSDLSSEVDVSQFETVVDTDGSIWHIVGVNVVHPGPSVVIYSFEVEQ